jgi:dipeptide/tripeptide permease
VILIFVFSLLEHTKFVEYLLDVIGLIILFVFLTYGVLEKKQRKNILLLILMIAVTLLFFACELQTNSSLIIFVQNYVKRHYLGITIPASAFASLEPGFVIISSLILLRIWKKFQNHEPKELTKIIIGLFLASSAFAVLVLSAKSIIISNHPASIGWIITASLLLGAGESCIMPPLIAAITHRAPANARGTFMGGLYLAIAFSGYLAGKIAGLTNHIFQQHNAETSLSIGYKITPFLLVFQHLCYLMLGTALILTLSNISYYLYRKRP